MRTFFSVLATPLVLVIQCVLFLSLCLILYVGSLLCGVVIRVLYSSAITLPRKRELVAIYCNCAVAACVLCHFHTVPWAGS